MARIALLTLYDSKAIGIRTIGSYLKKLGHECLLVFLKEYRGETIEEVLENNINYQMVTGAMLNSFAFDVNPITSNDMSRTLEVLREFSPDVFGISTRSFFDELAEGFLSEIRKDIPDALFVAGGYGPTLAYEKWMQFVDVVVRGDGEEAMADIVQCVDNNKPLKNIFNTVYKEDGDIVVMPLRAPEKNLSKYPHPFMPGECSVYIDEKFDFWEQEKHSPYGILTGRGCVGKCAYCSGGNWRTIYSDSDLSMPPRRMREKDDIIDELLKAKEKGYKSVAILDEFFVAPIATMYDLFADYHEKIGLPFNLNLHSASVEANPDFLEYLAKVGLQATAVAIQSGNESFSDDVYCRKQSNEKIIKFAQAIDKVDVAI